MPINEQDIARECLKQIETFRFRPTLHPCGKWTIGYGYNLNTHGYTAKEIDALSVNGWNRAHAITMLEHEIQLICYAMKRFDWWELIDSPRKAAVIVFCFLIGLPKFCRKRSFFKALESADYSTAATEMPDIELLRNLMITGDV